MKMICSKSTLHFVWKMCITGVSFECVNKSAKGMVKSKLQVIPEKKICILGSFDL